MSCVAPPIDSVVWSAVDWVCRELPPELVGAIITGFVVWLIQKIYADREFRRFRRDHALYLAHQLCGIKSQYEAIHAGTALNRDAAELKADDIQRYRAFIAASTAARGQIDNVSEFVFMGKGKRELRDAGMVAQALDALSNNLAHDAAYLEAKVDCQVSQILRQMRDDGSDAVNTLNLGLEGVTEHAHFTAAHLMEGQVNSVVSLLLESESIKAGLLDDYRTQRKDAWFASLGKKRA